MLTCQKCGGLLPDPGYDDDPSVPGQRCLCVVAEVCSFNFPITAFAPRQITIDHGAIDLASAAIQIGLEYLEQCALDHKPSSPPTLRDKAWTELMERDRAMLLKAGADLKGSQ